MKKKILIWICLLVALVLCLCGCYEMGDVITPIVPIDRSNEADIKLWLDLHISVGLISDPYWFADFEYLIRGDSDTLVDKRYSPLETEADVAKAARQALKDCYGDKYIDDGDEAFEVRRLDSPGTIVITYCAGSVIVAFHRTTGQLLTCIDGRLHDNFKKCEDLVCLKYTIDLLKADIKELEACGMIASRFKPGKDGESIDSAEAACEKAADFISGKLVSFTDFGPEFTAYFNKNADAWVVTCENDSVIVVMKKETGKVIFLYA